MIRSPNDWRRVISLARDMDSIDFAKFVLHELRGYRSRFNRNFDLASEEADAQTLANLLEAVRQEEGLL